MADGSVVPPRAPQPESALPPAVDPDSAAPPRSAAAVADVAVALCSELGSPADRERGGSRRSRAELCYESGWCPGCGRPLEPIAKLVRSAAGREVRLENVRTPAACRRAVDVIFSCCVVDREETSLKQRYFFISERLRQLRKDLFTQQYDAGSAAEAEHMQASVHALERMVRFYIACGHELCEETYAADNSDPMAYSATFNRKALEESMAALEGLYTRQRPLGWSFVHEGEMRCYSLLLKAPAWQAAAAAASLAQLPPDVVGSAEVRWALEAVGCVHTLRYSRFFKLLDRATYLQGCALRCTNSIELMRFVAIKRLASCAHPKQPASLALPELARLLRCASREELGALLGRAAGITLPTAAAAEAEAEAEAAAAGAEAAAPDDQAEAEAKAKLAIAVAAAVGMLKLPKSAAAAVKAPETRVADAVGEIQERRVATLSARRPALLSPLIVGHGPGGGIEAEHARRSALAMRKHLHTDLTVAYA